MSLYCCYIFFLPTKHVSASFIAMVEEGASYLKAMEVYDFEDTNHAFELQHIGRLYGVRLQENMMIKNIKVWVQCDSLSSFTLVGGKEMQKCCDFRIVVPILHHSEGLCVFDILVSQDTTAFRLNENDQLVSTWSRNSVLSLKGPEEFECLEGVKIVLDEERPNDKTQKWRFYENGIVNEYCGQSNGNYAITEIKDDSFDDILYLEHIDFSFVNPYNEKAIGVGDEVSTIY